MELLIVVALIVVVAVIGIAVLQPWNQIAKGFDAKRKSDLELIQKAVNDWYNDHGCYPKPGEICYDASSAVNICENKSGSWSSRHFTSQLCHICGSESTSPSFVPYLNKLPCDPEHKAKQYAYEVEADTTLSCNQSGQASTCPTWFKMYADFSSNTSSDLGSQSTNCAGGACGIAPNQVPTSIPLTPYPYGYDFGVTDGSHAVYYSPSFYCYNNSLKCNACGSTYATCQSSGNCREIFSSQEACKAKYPSG